MGQGARQGMGQGVRQGMRQGVRQGMGQGNYMPRHEARVWDINLFSGSPSSDPKFWGCSQHLARKRAELVRRGRRTAASPLAASILVICIYIYIYICIYIYMYTYIHTGKSFAKPNGATPPLEIAGR